MMQSGQQRVWFVVILIVAAVAGVIVSVIMHPPVKHVVLPPGSVQIKTFHYPISFIAQLKGAPDAGKQIFKGYCGHCHARQPIIPLGAPRIGDVKLWTVISKQGMHELLKLTSGGFGRMPARGGCFECSDKQLKQAIAYILSNSTSHDH